MLLESYSEPDSGLLRFETLAMGTQNVLLLAGGDPGSLRGAAQEAFEELDRLEQRLSKFIPSSDVALLNSLGASRPVRVGEDLRRLLLLSRQAWELTGGAFDPTIGELMRAWGLVDMEGRIPDDAEIQDLLSMRGMHHVLADPDARTASFDRPGVSIDLGAIGKGYAVDLIAKRIQARGIEAGALISGRSSVLVWGAPPGDARWKLEVVHPDDPEESLAVLEVEPGAVSTSGAYARRFFRGGKEYGHVIDPRTGRPARGLKGVTIWTESAILGDVLSTALFVLGREALAPGGCGEKLAAAWARPGGAPRGSALLVEEAPGVWGGLKAETFHIGAPGFTLSAQSGGVG